jgi:CO/xanthine dehydrogenase FAD-binding subunit
VKPAVFEYHRAESVEHALALLAEHADDVKVLAGGQSLMPMLNFRLARPGRLVDINGLGALASVRRADSMLHIGALTRQAVMERSETVQAHWPLLHEALSFVAHPQIRNRGTIGGSVAHADPAAELPVALTALDASVTVASRRGARSIAMRDLYITHLTTCLEADELLTEISVPPISPLAGSSFVEYARRHGDFGLGGAAVVLTPGSDGLCERASIVLLAAGPTPLRVPEAEHALVSRVIDEDIAREAAACAVREIAPTGDIHGDTRYRRRLIEALVRRAVLKASHRAGLRSEAT